MGFSPGATGNRSPLQIHNRGFSASNTVLLTCVRERNAPAPTSYLLTGRPCNGELSFRRITPLRRGLTRTAPFRVGLPAFFLYLSCLNVRLCRIGMYYGIEVFKCKWPRCYSVLGNDLCRSGQANAVRTRYARRKASRLLRHALILYFSALLYSLREKLSIDMTKL